MILFKPTVFLFLGLLGIAMGFDRAFEREWQAVPDLFFGSMFFVMFLACFWKVKT